MDTPTFMSNPQYVAFVSLLRRLHFLMAEGKGDTDEADAVRDDMDGPWAGMNTDEQERTRGLSADLYTLEPGGGAPAAFSGGEAIDKLRADLRRAWEAHDWEAGLSLLRQHPHVLPLHEETFLRGWCWNELGDPDSAALFFRRAAELDPHNAKYPIAVIEAHLRAGHIDEALRYARTILDPAAQKVA